MTPLISKMVKIAPDAELYHWFDASQLCVESVSLDPLIHTPLPYEMCAIVGREGFHEWLVILRQVESTVAYIGWTIGPTGYRKHPAFTYTRGPDGLQLNAIDAQIPDKDTVRGLLATVAAWLIALDQKTIAHVPVARKSFINSKRKAKGLGPILFDWHTVVIGTSAPKTDPKGGTHASPRLHDRRGHWRTLKASGKRVWVRDCKVGNASKGAIFKDYTIKEIIHAD